MPPADTRGFRRLAAAVTLPVVGLLVISSANRPETLSSEPVALTAWAILLFLVDLLPVQFTRNYRITMSLPVLLAAGFSLGTLQAGLLGFLASADPRELRGEITLWRALFNRSQISLSCLAATAVFEVAGGSIQNWPEVLIPALAAVAADVFLNQGLVGVAIIVDGEESPRKIAAEIFRGAPAEQIASYFSLGLIALLVATAYTNIGVWALPVSLVPLVLARQMFMFGKASAAAKNEVNLKTQALQQLSSQIAVERRDERILVAGSLHDEVLQPIHRVHLMGAVLRNDLSSGKLLDLEDDLPELLKATEAAADSIRTLIRDLRSSSVGAGGLTPTLSLLVDQLEAQTRAKFICRLEDVGGSAQVQLLVYQVAREALNNAIKHSEATEIEINLTRPESEILLTIRDDGVGFEPSNVDRARHFGLQLIQERVRTAGGEVELRSCPGEGTELLARFPKEAPF